MKFSLFVKSVTTIVQVILALVILIVFTAFAIRPTEVLLFTNALILVMIMVQLYSVNVLLDVYEKFQQRVRKK